MYHRPKSIMFYLSSNVNLAMRPSCLSQDIDSRGNTTPTTTTQMIIRKVYRSPNESSKLRAMNKPSTMSFITGTCAIPRLSGTCQRRSGKSRTVNVYMEINRRPFNVYRYIMCENSSFCNRFPNMNKFRPPPHSWNRFSAIIDKFKNSSDLATSGCI